MVLGVQNQMVGPHLTSANEAYLGVFECSATAPWQCSYWREPFESIGASSGSMKPIDTLSTVVSTMTAKSSTSLGVGAKANGHRSQSSGPPPAERSGPVEGNCGIPSPATSDRSCSTTSSRERRALIGVMLTAWTQSSRSPESHRKHVNRTHSTYNTCEGDQVRREMTRPGMVPPSIWACRPRCSHPQKAQHRNQFFLICYQFDPVPMTFPGPDHPEDV